MDQEETIASLEAEIKRLKKLAYRDELTGLLNRRGFLDQAEKFLGEIRIFKKSLRKNFALKDFSIIFFDADYFKKINDKFGHEAGDRALKFAASVIEDRTREIDIVARWGGEEMVVGLVGASEKDSYEVAENIRRRIEAAEFEYKKDKIKFTISAGVACFDKEGSAEELIESADKALYEAKRRGRNRTVRYSEL